WSACSNSCGSKAPEPFSMPETGWGGAAPFFSGTVGLGGAILGVSPRRPYQRAIVAERRAILAEARGAWPEGRNDRGDDRTRRPDARPMPRSGGPHLEGIPCFNCRFPLPQRVHPVSESGRFRPHWFKTSKRPRWQLVPAPVVIFCCRGQSGT